MKANELPGIIRLWAKGPIAGETWRATAHLLLGAPVAVGGAVQLLLLASPAMLVVTVPLALLMVFPASWWIADVQRSRFSALLGVEIVLPGRDSAEGFWERLTAEAADQRTWRRISFHLLASVTETAAAFVIAASWSLALGMVSLPVVVAIAPDLAPPAGVHGFDLHRAEALGAIGAAGFALVFLTPWLARALASLDVATARALLEPDRTAALSHRVEALTSSRTAVVDAADAERRRIERDLHDGTQQRLVALAMNLGMIRASHPELPEIAEAHEEAKLTLAELRDFVRGLHPAVLNDRGLDAALSGIAARSPVPVTLHVDLPGRPDATLEAVAYFVVSEALANAAKHASASRAGVAVVRDGGLIRVTVTDDGVGGAHLGKGSGLRGLQQRVASVDGVLSVHSPVGGPTEILAELPCAS
ncbi:sensor histidine kinase [Actinocorallia longicatena]|uniref:histidine kinase n=1 Tax=Actinocorallia longicatena TaxID=111803 RepID=A0ABP6QDN5_9ACTN